jgi:hypothetical protein
VGATERHLKCYKFDIERPILISRRSSFLFSFFPLRCLALCQLVRIVSIEDRSAITNDREDQAQRRDSSNPSSSTHTQASSSSGIVLPGTKTSEQTGLGAQPSQSPTTFPVGTSTNIDNQKPGSPPPSRSSSSASSSVSHRSKPSCSSPHLHE